MTSLRSDGHESERRRMTKIGRMQKFGSALQQPVKSVDDLVTREES